MEWAYRIFAAVVVMVGPGLAGQWLDRRWGTGFIGLIGFALGLTAGIAYLVTVTRPRDRSRQDGRSATKL
jgi:hypothetical protein